MRIILAEDFGLLREGLSNLLTGYGFTVVAAVGDGEGLLSAARAYRPDAVLVDVRLPPGQGTEGLRAALELKQEHPDLGVLMLSHYVEAQYSAELLASGARGVGYLLKERMRDGRELADALHRVAAGGVVVDAEVVSALVRPAADAGRLAALSEREREVLGLMAQGRSNSAIAEALTISPRTAEAHVRAIFTKLDLPATASDDRRVLAVLEYLR